MRADEERPDGVERIFRGLRDREAPELDSDASWRRLRASLPRRTPVPAWAWGWRAVAAAATVALAAGLVTWQAWRSSGDTVAEAPPATVAEAPAAATDTATGLAAAAGDRDLVLLAGARSADEPAPGTSPAEIGTGTAQPGAALLDVRLLREGVDDALALGAGGADATADIDATLQAVLPERRYGMLGRWQGDLGEGAMETELAPGYRLAFEVDAAEPHTLRRVRLIGERGPLVADEIRLDAGQVYLFGVRDADGRTSDVLLAIRLRPVEPERPDGDR